MQSASADVAYDISNFPSVKKAGDDIFQRRQEAQKDKENNRFFENVEKQDGGTALSLADFERM